jgi:hypothetical protein
MANLDNYIKQKINSAVIVVRWTCLEGVLPVWGARGSEFESRRPDQDYKRVSSHKLETLFSLLSPSLAPHSRSGAQQHSLPRRRIDRWPR